MIAALSSTISGLNRSSSPLKFSVSSNRDWGFTWIAALLALLPRLYVAIAWAREPVWDGHYYHFGAERIAAGLGYSEDVLIGGHLVWRPWCHYPVGYSAVLGGAYKVFGSSLVVAPLVNVAIGVATVMVAHRVARLYLSTVRARVAAFLVAVHPGLILYTALLMTEPLAALSLLLAIWIAASTRSRWGAGGAGIVFGLGALVRPPSLLALPLLLLVYGLPFRVAFKRTVLAGVCALAVILPWSYRNCQVMDGCALLSTNGGWNLAIGALSSSGRFDTLRAEDGCKVVTGQVQQDRCWAEVGAAAIAKNPLRWLKMIPKKLQHTYNYESFAVEYLREANPRLWSDARRERARTILTVFHHLLMILGSLSIVGFAGWRRWFSVLCQAGLLLGLVWFVKTGLQSDPPPLFWLAVVLPLVAVLPLPGAARQGPVGRYLLGTLLVTSLTTAIFFGEDRYHLVVSPMLCLLAAAALRPTEQAPAAQPRSLRSL